MLGVSFLCLIFVLPVAVICRVPHRLVNDETGITLADVKEIETLVALTKEIEESGGHVPLPKAALHVSEEDVSFFVYNNNDRTPTQVAFADAHRITEVSAFDLSLPAIFIIHGWHNTYNSSFSAELGEAYLEEAEVNVISVNWDDAAASLYVLAYSAVGPMGRYIGQFIKNVSVAYDYPLDKVSLVGHSLGAQIAGFVGKETDGKLHSITGLDAAGPLFFHIDPDGRLNKGDAQYVQAIHTNAGFLGVNYNIGDADYWPNGGKSQPGCGTDLTGSCAHHRSYQYFIESLHTLNFISKSCDSYTDYTEGHCITAETAVMGGVSANSSVVGTFYLHTNSTAPYALGNVNL